MDQETLDRMKQEHSLAEHALVKAENLADALDTLPDDMVAAGVWAPGHVRSVVAKLVRELEDRVTGIASDIGEAEMERVVEAEKGERWG